MLSRKQQWRRVRCRRRQTPAMIPQSAPSKLSACDIASELGKSSSASTEKSFDDDVSSSCTALSTWSSFDSVQSVLEDAEVEEDAEERGEGGGGGGALSPPASPAVAAVDVRGKGVTFEPRVQVFLVTHKSELDHRAKQALWWTGRDAAINKKAWLNHLGQPGCGRQSAGQSHRQQQQFHAARAGLYGAGDITASRIGGGGGGGYGGLSSAYGPSYDAGLLAAGRGGGEEDDREQTVGILGCRCLACLTEGDEHEWSPAPQTQYQLHQQQQQQQRQQEELQYDAYAAACYRGDYYSTATASGGDRGASKGWPSSEQWQMEGDDLEEMGSLSYSPGSSRSDSPMLAAYEGTAYSSNAYFWD